MNDITIQIPKGRYIVAVSGGVDSVVLLDLLTKQTCLKLIVAHFDHGIRADSSKDRQLVATMSQKYQLLFEYAEGKLGSNASEETAREARYEFLQLCRKKHRAKAIITAHHQDDVLETMIINLLRGTHRKGLSSLSSTGGILRPLVNTPKSELVKYAKANNLTWNEDPTNLDTDYLRNRIRHQILPKLSNSQRQKLIETNRNMLDLNLEIDELLGKLHNKTSINKQDLINLPHKLALELVASWLRDNGVRDFSAKSLDLVVIGAKTLRPNSKIVLKSGLAVIVGSGELTIQSRQ